MVAAARWRSGRGHMPLYWLRPERATRISPMVCYMSVAISHAWMTFARLTSGLSWRPGLANRMGGLLPKSDEFELSDLGQARAALAQSRMRMLQHLRILV